MLVVSCLRLWNHIMFLNLVTSWNLQEKQYSRNSPPEVLLQKGVLKICSKFTGKGPCQSAISIKLQSNFIEITLRHGCSLVNLLHILRTPFPKNISEGLLLIFSCSNSRKAFSSLPCASGQFLTQ